MSQAEHVTLAIESAVSGGGISLLRGGVEIASWIGSSNVSKAEDLLFNIDLLLRDNDISRLDVGSIAVSAGPGSFTGIRIGIATALGFKAGLGIEMSSESALKAMIFATNIDGIATAALPVGRNAVCVQTFEMSNGTIVAIDEPGAITEERFAELVGEQPTTKFIVHGRLHEHVSSHDNAINFGLGLAQAIATICELNRGVVVEPLFISKSF